MRVAMREAPTAHVARLCVCVLRLTFDVMCCGHPSPLSQVAREGAMEDFYRLGIVFLELVLASFSEDNAGALAARRRMGKDVKDNMLTLAEDRDFSQVPTPPPLAPLCVSGCIMLPLSSTLLVHRNPLLTPVFRCSCR